MATFPLVLDPNDPLLQLRFGATLPPSQMVQQPRTIDGGSLSIVPPAATPPQRISSGQQLNAPPPAAASPDPNTGMLNQPSPRAALSLLPNPFSSSGSSDGATQSPLGLSPQALSSTSPNDSISSGAMNRLQAADNRLGYLTRSGSGLQQITSPVDANGNPTGQHKGFGWKLLGGLGTAADIGLSAVAPGVAALTPGTSLHHQLLINQQEGNAANAFSQLQNNATMQDSQAQAQQRQALAVQEQAKAQALLHPKPTSGQILYDANKTPIGYQDGVGNYMGPNDPNLPHGLSDIFSAAQRKNPTNAFELWQQQNPKGTAEDYMKLSGEGKVKPLPQQLLEAEQGGDQQTARNILRVISQTQVQPKIDVHAAESPREPAGSYQPIYDPQGGVHFFNPTTGKVVDPPTGDTKAPPKVADQMTTADKNRASLARIAMQNLDQIQNIVQRRGDLFGPGAGRLTSVDQMVGSNDPDLVALGNQVHNFAMANAGIHGSRSFQNVEAAEQELLNHFKSGQQGILGGVQANRVNLNAIINPSSAGRGVPTPNVVPQPSTHDWSASGWQRTHPGQDVNAAVSAAKQQGFQVVQ